MSIWSGSDAGNDESTAEPMVEPLEQMRDHVEVPPATSPVDAQMDIAPPEMVPETKKKSATMVKKKKTTKANRKEEVESVVPIIQPASPRRVSVTSEKSDADTDEVAGRLSRKPCFARRKSLTQGTLSLHQAARSGAREIAEMLIGKNECVSNYMENIEEVQDDDGFSFRCTPLQVAAYFGQVHIVKLLLNEKADVNSYGDSEQKWTPLHLAGMRGHTAAVEFLVNGKADHHAKDLFGQIPLELAMGAPDSAPGMILATQTNPDKQISMQDLIMLLNKAGQNATEIVTNLMIPALAVKENGSRSKDWKPHVRLSDRLHVVTCPRFKQFKTPLSRRVPKEALVLDTDLNLPALERNLGDVGEAKVVLKVLPYFVASKAYDRKVLSALANTGNEETLATDTVHAMIAAAWSKTRVRTAAEIMLNAVNVGLLCYVSYGFTKQDPGAVQALYVLTFIHIKMAVEILVEQLEAVFPSIRSAYSDWKNFNIVSLLNVNKPWFRDIDQVSDMGYQVLGWVALLKQMHQLYDPENPAKLMLEKRWMAMFSATAWFRFCYSLRGEPWFGPRILPIIFALRDTVVFFFFALICVCAATHAYYNLELREDSEHSSSLYQALLQVTRLGIFGDFDLFDFEGADPYLQLKDHPYGKEEMVYIEEDPRPSKDRYIDVHILFYGVGLGITILLMNLLTGVLGSNFELYQDRAPELFNRARAKLLLEIEGRPIIRLLRCLDRVRRRLKESNRWHVAFLVRSVWTFVAVLQSLFHFVLLLVALPFLVIVAPFCSWSGVHDTIQWPLKAYWSKFTNIDNAELQYIWVVQKEDHSGVELRSLHALVKEKVNDLEGTLQSRLSRMEDRLMEALEEIKDSNSAKR